MRTIGVVSLAGGQGKTTVALLLGLTMIAAKKKIVWVDADPQHSLTSKLRCSVGTEDPTLLEVIKGDVQPSEAIYELGGGRFLIPADRGLESAKTYLASKGSPATALKRVLRPLREVFDYAIIDSPPQSSHLTWSVCGASDEILIPCEATTKGISVSGGEIVGSLANTLDLLLEMDEEAIPRGEVLAVLPFKDKWVGRSQVIRSKLAIERMQKLTSVREVGLGRAILDSECYQKACDNLTTLSDLGQPEMQLLFNEILEMLEKRNA